MAIDNQSVVGGPPPRTAYGRFIRERGTIRLVLWAVALWLLWTAYSALHSSLMYQVKWPALKPDSAGLTVLGLQDKPRGSWHPKYVAINSTNSWQIRRPDDDDSGDDTTTENTPESQDRGNDPGSSHPVTRGAAVTIEEVMQNCPVVLIGRNFSGATVIRNYDWAREKAFWNVNLSLTDEGESRYWQFSRDHDKERLAFVLNGELATCPRMDHMETKSLTISPIWVEADAKKLADSINNQKR